MPVEKTSLWHLRCRVKLVKLSSFLIFLTKEKYVKYDLELSAIKHVEIRGKLYEEETEKLKSPCSKWIINTTIRLRRRRKISGELIIDKKYASFELILDDFFKIQSCFLNYFFRLKFKA